MYKIIKSKLQYILIVYNYLHFVSQLWKYGYRLEMKNSELEPLLFTPI